MAKRFTDTNKYKKPFVRSLQGPYKLLWDYLYHDCDNAGIWIVDFEIAQIYIGSDMRISREEALKAFNGYDPEDPKVIEIDGGTKWFIPSFIQFQYGELNPQNRAHSSVINTLTKYNLYEKNKGLISPLQGAMDKDKEIGKRIKGVIGGEESPDFTFDDFWNLYGKKMGDKPKCEKKWLKLKPEEREKIMRILPDWISQFRDKQFQPYPATFLNQQRWNDEIKIKQNGHEKHNAKPPDSQTDFDNYDPYADIAAPLDTEPD